WIGASGLEVTASPKRRTVLREQAPELWNVSSWQGDRFWCRRLIRARTRASSSLGIYEWGKSGSNGAASVIPAQTETPPEKGRCRLRALQHKGGDHALMMLESRRRFTTSKMFAGPIAAESKISINAYDAPQRVSRAATIRRFL